MNAEERLKEWYKACEFKPTPPELLKEGVIGFHVSGMAIAPEHINLIADLVVERTAKLISASK